MKSRHAMSSPNPYTDEHGSYASRTPRMVLERLVGQPTGFSPDDTKIAASLEARA